MMPMVDGEVPAYWWDAEADRCMVIGIFKHGSQLFVILLLLLFCGIFSAHVYVSKTIMRSLVILCILELFILLVS